MKLVLGPGDTVLLYTDDLVETRGNDLYDDLERLRQRLNGQPHASPATLLDQLTETTDDLVDDVTLIAVQVRPTV